MNTTAEAIHPQEAVLVLAPIGRDATLLVRALTGAGLPAIALTDDRQMFAAVQRQEAGALLLTSEAMPPQRVRELAALLSAQPHWSDLPVLLLVPGGQASSTTGEIESVFRPLPNVTFLERPIRPATLNSVARAALRGRARQYEVKRVIEERDRASASLIESEKLAAVGRLAASIAHEINNPLEALTNLIYLVQSDNSLHDDTRELLRVAESELLRASHITQQSLRFHRQATRQRALSAEELFAPVLAIYGGRLNNSRIRVQAELDDRTEVECYEGEIRQVLSNLIGNAIDAMRNGGTLRLRARRLTDWRSGLPALNVTIADTGHGMPPEVRSRIFQAFYTTKGLSGTGLGLWISADIVHKHRGRMRVRSSTASGRSGTIFSLMLPLAERAEMAA